MKLSAQIVASLLILCTAAFAQDFNPTIGDPGFEKGGAGWGWQVVGGGRATYAVDTKDPHSGKCCALFTNQSGLAPNVYGRLATSVNVLPSARYELSCWIRGEDVKGEAGSSHMTDWNTYMLSFPSGTFGWQKISTVFTTQPGQQSLNIGINITNRCKSLAIDDIALRPLGGQLQGDGISGIILANPTAVGHDTRATVCLLIECSNKSAVAVQGVISGAAEVSRKSFPLKQGENKIDWQWNTGSHPFGKYNCTVRVVDSDRDGKALAKGSTGLDIVNSPLFADLDKIDARKKQFDALYAQCKSKGIRLDYPTVTKTMLEQFLPIAREDVRRGFDYRAKWAIGDFNRSLDSAMSAMQACLADPKLAPVTKRYRTGKVAIDGLSFIGDRIDSLGVKDRGPVFFCGYGHFGQVREDIPRFPGYGVNIIQIEIGPSAVLTSEDKVDLTAIKDVCKVLDNAAKHNVMVNVLLSPHYFPAWAMAKWPQLAKGGGGFLGFCVDAPEAKQVVEKFLRIVVPMLKDKPALHSLCLTNEPLFNNVANCDNTKQIWIEYLTRTHGDIATLNKRYGTSYASFADNPYGGDPQAYDWIICDMQRFAGWHKWMADVIHEMAPNVPIHAKVMSNELNVGAIGFATDQELFGNLLQINGNDCYVFPSNNGNMPLDPWLQNTSYDMQRSFARKPIFNSENHIAPDGSNYYIVPEHFRTALWQGAIHGQGATTIWVWEHAYDNSNGFIGSVMDRPGCAEAVGTTCLDLNRFSGEVTALETAKAPVAIVYSMSSMIRHGQEHVNSINGVYYCLDFSGVKIDFISEKQLAEGKGAQYKLIIAPEVETITDAALDGIRALPSSTRLALLGNCFARDPYGKPRSDDSIKPIRERAVPMPPGDLEKALWPELRRQLGLSGASPEISVVDAKTDAPIWGVEWLPVTYNGKTIVNLINLTSKPIDIKLVNKNDSPVSAVDLFSLGGREPVTTLKPITPVLAEVK